MIKYFGALTIVLLLLVVISRAIVMKKKGIQAMHFGKTDKTDYLLPPIAFFYFYLIFAVAFGWPSVSGHRFFDLVLTSWGGVLACVFGLFLLIWSIISFGNSFRVGIDEDTPDALVTSGAFSIFRNPIYIGFACVLLGQFLLFSNWIILLYLIAGIWAFHRQVLREEEFLKEHYGAAFDEYCSSVRRYL